MDVVAIQNSFLPSRAAMGKLTGSDSCGPRPGLGRMTQVRGLTEDVIV